MNMIKTKNEMEKNFSSSMFSTFAYYDKNKKLLFKIDFIDHKYVIIPIGMFASIIEAFDLSYKEYESTQKAISEIKKAAGQAFNILS